MAKFIVIFGRWASTLAYVLATCSQLKYTDLNLDTRTPNLTEAKTGKQTNIRLNAPAIAIISRRKQEQLTDILLF